MIANNIVFSWPLATDYVLTADGRFWGEADIDEFRRAPHLLRMTQMRHRTAVLSN